VVLRRKVAVLEWAWWADSATQEVAEHPLARSQPVGIWWRCRGANVLPVRLDDFSHRPLFSGPPHQNADRFQFGVQPLHLIERNAEQGKLFVGEWQ
jgi:hypothetical protein